MKYEDVSPSDIGETGVELQFEMLYEIILLDDSNYFDDGYS